MNTKNTTVRPTVISLEKPRDVLDSNKSEPKIYEQPGPSVSTSDFIPITTPKSNEIKNSTKTATNNVVAVAMETTEETLKRKLTLKEIEQQKIKSKRLNIKVACEALLYDLNGVTSADQKIICTLNSIIKFYRQIGVDEETNAKITEVEISLDRTPRTSLVLSCADDYVIEGVKRINVSIGLFIDEKIELASLITDIKSFVDSLYSKLADFRRRMFYVIYPEDMPKTGTH